jgi:hypothetical protein
MRSFDFLRSAVLAASLVATLGSVGTAFAGTIQAHEAQQTQPRANTSPYDSPNFVVPENDING